MVHSKLNLSINHYTRIQSNTMFATLVGVKLAGPGKVERDVVVTESILLFNLHRVFQFCLHSSFSDDGIAAVVRERTVEQYWNKWHAQLHGSAIGPHIASIILIVSPASQYYTAQGWTELESARIEPAWHICVLTCCCPLPAALQVQVWQEGSEGSQRDSAVPCCWEDRVRGGHYLCL